jgi:hypothetical protein
MEPRIYACNVITNFEHEVRGRLRVDDFLIVAVDSLEDAASLFGSVYVDSKSMIKLLQWARSVDGESESLLISIDGKYGAIATKSEIDNPKPGSEVLFIGDDVWAPVSKVRAAVQRILANQPEVARKLNFRASQRSVPDRVSFLGMKEDFSPETINREINGAFSNIESASDDALVWITIIGSTQGHRLDKKVVEDVDRELQMRLDKRSEFRSTFFPLNKVTMQEISARARRANRDLQQCLLMFPIGQDFDDEVSYQYARRLSNDRLTDLCVVLNYQEQWGHAPFKHLVGNLYERIFRAIGRN